MIREILFVLIQMAANIIQAVTGFAGGPLAMPPSIALVGVNDAKASITLILWFATAYMTVRCIKDINWKQLGIIISFMPALLAPIIFSFNPPIGNILPLRVISPVIEMFDLICLLVNALIIALVIAIPADGPSLGVAPAGT